MFNKILKLNNLKSNLTICVRNQKEKHTYSGFQRTKLVSLFDFRCSLYRLDNLISLDFAERNVS